MSNRISLPPLNIGFNNNKYNKKIVKTPSPKKGSKSKEKNAKNFKITHFYKKNAEKFYFRTEKQ